MIGAYLIGEPGAGKSTLVRAVLAEVPSIARAKPFAHVVYFDEQDRVAGVQLGAAHPTFPGTDRLSMGVQPLAIDWVRSAPAPVVLGEGDRLATAGFLDALDASCEKWWLLWLRVPAELAQERRAARGSKQNETWLAGRRTKVARLAERYPRNLLELDGAQPLAEMARSLRDLPVFGRITT